MRCRCKIGITINTEHFGNPEPMKSLFRVGGLLLRVLAFRDVEVPAAVRK